MYTIIRESHGREKIVRKEFLACVHTNREATKPICDGISISVTYGISIVN